MSARRSRGEPPEDNDHGQDRWLVSYADFITLMFAFFAVLYATSNKDAEKAHDFQESIKKYLIKAGAFGESGSQMNQGIKANSPIEPPIETFNQSKPEAVKGLDEAEIYIESHLSKQERQKYILDLTADDWGVRIVMPSSALYATGSDKFRGDAMAFINKLSELAAQTKRKILVEGHVASQETGTFKSTWEFASARSLNMLRYIQKKQNFPAAQMASASLADSRPLYQNQRPELNSRVEVVLLNPEFEF